MARNRSKCSMCFKYFSNIFYCIIESIISNNYNLLPGSHLGLEDAQNEMVRLEELNRAKEEVAKAAGEKKPVTQRSFRAV